MIRTIQNGTVLSQGAVVSIEQTLRRRKETSWELEHVEIATISAGGTLLRGELVESSREQRDD
ncbi:MAG: hypothetical protein GYB53_21815 [Rhodobacteraceae bacterium]|nr:hypothetical protein [Paracoccaceae bacterium]